MNPKSLRRLAAVVLLSLGFTALAAPSSSSTPTPVKIMNTDLEPAVVRVVRDPPPIEWASQVTAYIPNSYVSNGLLFPVQPPSGIVRLKTISVTAEAPAGQKPQIFLGITKSGVTRKVAVPLTFARTNGTTDFFSATLSLEVVLSGASIAILGQRSEMLGNVQMTMDLFGEYAP